MKSLKIGVSKIEVRKIPKK